PYIWPPEKTDRQGDALGAWPTPVTGDPFALLDAFHIYVSSDDVLFRFDGSTQPPRFVEIDLADLSLEFRRRAFTPTQNDIHEVRRSMESVIEGKAQLSQNKQIFLQDLVSQLQKWLTFVTSIL